MARALPIDGKLITLEAEKKHALVARQNIARAGFHNMVDIRVGQAVDSLQDLVAEGVDPFDLVFIDADKPNNPLYLKWALQLTKPGSCIIADNIVREGKVIDSDATDPRICGVQEGNRLIAEEPRLTATAIQTVGCKGYDGFSLILVTR
jgi:predicted O-methyltransferase YrrM